MRTERAVGKRKKSTSKRYVCSSPTCAKAFEKPKIVRCCPFCLSKIEKTPPAKKHNVIPKEPSESPIESMPVTKEKLRETETVKLEILTVPETEVKVENFMTKQVETADEKTRR